MEGSLVSCLYNLCIWVLQGTQSMTLRFPSHGALLWQDSALWLFTAGTDRGETKGEPDKGDPDPAQQREAHRRNKHKTKVQCSKVY